MMHNNGTSLNDKRLLSFIIRFLKYWTKSSCYIFQIILDDLTLINALLPCHDYQTNHPLPELTHSGISILDLSQFFTCTFSSEILSRSNFPFWSKICPHFPFLPNLKDVTRPQLKWTTCSRCRTAAAAEAGWTIFKF